MMRRFTYRPQPVPAPEPEPVSGDTGPLTEDEAAARASLDDLAAAAGREWAAKSTTKIGSDGIPRDTEWHGWRK